MKVILVFKGTRVPVSAVYENLRDGATIDDFIAWFPGAERRHIEAVLDAEAAAGKGSDLSVRRCYSPL